MITVKSREDFLKFVKRLLPGQIEAAEIGVLRGDFSEMILQELNPISLYLIDPFEMNEKKYISNGLTTAYSSNADELHVKHRFAAEVNKGKVIIFKTYSHEIVKGMWAAFEFIYHDASHLYEDVKRDLKEWISFLRPNGLMCGHDYINHKDFGVIQAVDEFCAEHNFEMIIFNENGGDYALKRKV